MVAYGSLTWKHISVPTASHTDSMLSYKT